MSDVEIRDLGREVQWGEFSVVVRAGEISVYLDINLEMILCNREGFNSWLDAIEAEVARQKAEIEKAGLEESGLEESAPPFEEEIPDELESGLNQEGLTLKKSKHRKKRSDAGQPRKPRTPKATREVEDAQVPQEPDPPPVDPAKVVTTYTNVSAMKLPEGGYQVMVDYKTADGQEHAVAGKGETPYGAVLAAKSRLQTKRAVTVHSPRLEWILENNSIDLPPELRV